MKKILTLFFSVLLLVNSTMTIVADTSKVKNITKDDGYSTLNEAIGKAGSGDVLKLIDDVNVTEQVSIENKEIVLDLNGKTIKYTGETNLNSGVLLIHNGAKLTINDETNLGKINSTEKAYAAIALTKKDDDPTNKASLIINGGIITGDYYAISGNGSRHNTYIEINGGVLNGTHENDNYTIYHPQSGDVKITGGILNGDSVLGFKSGKLTITGGTFNATGTKKEYVHDGSGIVSTGDAVYVEACDYLGGVPVVVEISGGEFHSKYNKAFAYYQQSSEHKLANEHFISGGSFSDLNVLKYVACNSDKEVNIKLNSNVVAANGVTVPECKNLVVDFDKHTYYTEKPGAGSTGTTTQAFQLLGGNITFKNGTIGCTSDNKDFRWDSNATIKGVAMVIQNYSNLTLENMTIDGTNIAHNGNNVRYVVSNNSGNVNIINSTITACDDDYAFDSCKYGSYEIPTVTLENSKITGKVEATGGDINFKSGTVVNGQVRVGENKDGGATGSNVTIETGATINNQDNYAAIVFGNNELNICGNINGIIGTNGNAYNAGSKITIGNGANIVSTSAGIYMPNGSLSIGGGTITGTTAVYYKSNDLTITGGTLIGNGPIADYTYNGNGFNETGDALVIDACNYPSQTEGISITVSGGNFKSMNAKSIGSYCGNDVSEPIGKFVYGGNFEKDIDEDLIATGYKKAISTEEGYSKTVVKFTDKTIDVKEEVLINEVGDDNKNVTNEDKVIINNVINKVETDDLVGSVKASELEKIIDDAVHSTPVLGSLIEFNVDVFVEVEAKKASLSQTVDENKTITFKVTPFVVVRGTGENIDKKSVPIQIKNSQLSSNAKIKVTLPTCGIIPVEVVHIRENGSKEYFYATGDKKFTYNESDKTITIEITDFSSIVINAKVTKPAPTNPGYRAPNTGIN